ncbi:tyrosine-protein phosphatase [Periweissella ghanensis]|uniref:Tyrosine-protein phosphatase n=1 Tax=Periweissella ghanensis TaxID=467997 RepID=A0ABN8BTN0_9LACO|nr:CpsB/CapC family capsule biosynthesis tyrosine phosphatase [Periweissella ghanensis]MCM0600242.1 tyrosine protein phosphatase [Periweissella ghanensis]CAH0419126.1 Tyrosine-protein phosphatase YwqE [Periweissella ghanensis]
MIDIHSHLLPGIDDGSPSWDASIELARQAVSDGIEVALMTPHHQNGKYINPGPEVIKLTDEFQTLLDEENIPLKVFPSQEVRINSEIITDLGEGEIVGTDEDTRYFLLEFPDNSVPSFTKDLVFRILQMGVTPIIVHPERNTALMAHPEILFELVNQGAISQITASSLVGTFGKAVQAFSQDIIQNGLTHLIASDAHYLPGRKYEMTGAFSILGRLTDYQHVKAFHQNAKAVVNGDSIIRFDETPIKKRKLFAKY